ncbi:MAG: type II CAAX prenyl endopeptidase Rce1 family protein [Candidatus Hermodarchaeota archaeon]
MTEKSLSLYAIAKYANKELLLESLLQAKGSFQSLFLERYRKRQRSLKIKVLATKILYSIIFGILPVMLIFTYIEIIQTADLYPFSPDNIIFTGVIFFGLYFVLQFFNFFLMGILESSMVMSGLIFSWFETLPIPREKLRKLAYLTIFRTFDIPIICIILGFPITMLIQTQNILIFLISLGISTVNIVFSFDLLILFGERLHRVLYSRKTSPKKALAIRLFNIFSYVAVILGTIYIIQWVFGSIEYVFGTMILFNQAEFLNIIFSTLPYPFNPSYILSLAITPNLLSVNLWISTFVGLGLFIIITYVVHMKTSKTLFKITNYSSVNSQYVYQKEEIKIKIKTRTSVRAFLRKDLSVASHDIKVFLSLVMPIILACIFTFSFNIGLVSSPVIFERDVIIYCLGILLFCPIISSMLVYGISYIDLSGEAVLAALPIIPRDRVKAKLVLMITLQTIALFSPTLIYLLTPKFPNFLFATIIAAPFVWIFLLLTYELKIYFFNKFGKRYVIGDINPQKRIVKWALIICIQYVINFWITSFVLIFYIYQLLSAITTFYIIFTIVSIVLGILVLNKMFPNMREKRQVFPKKSKPTFFTDHIWVSTLILLFCFFVNLLISTVISTFFIGLSAYDPYAYGYYNILGIIGVALFNLSFFPLFFYLIPRFLGLPYGKQRLDKYLTNIHASWLIKSKKILIWSFLGTLSIFLVNLLINIPYYIISPGIVYINQEILFLIYNFSIIFWQELLFRGIFMTMLLKKRKNSTAIILNSVTVLLFFTIAQIGMYPGVPLFMNPLGIITVAFRQILSAFLFVKTKSLIPGILSQLSMSVLTLFIGFPYF